MEKETGKSLTFRLEISIVRDIFGIERVEISGGYSGERDFSFPLLSKSNAVAQFQELTGAVTDICQVFERMRRAESFEISNSLLIQAIRMKEDERRKKRERMARLFPWLFKASHDNGDGDCKQREDKRKE